MIWNILIPEEKDPTFDKVTAVTLRQAENKYLSQSDKAELLFKELAELDFKQLELHQPDAIKNLINDKYSEYKILMEKLTEFTK
jgi:hypothetical protein